MALSITVNGGGTFTASMEEGPVSFSASLGAVGPQGPAGANGQGVPVGGTTGQVLAKASGTDYDTEWVARNPFDQDLNTTDGVNFDSVTTSLDVDVGGDLELIGIGSGINFPNGTNQTTALPTGTDDGYIIEWDAETNRYESVPNEARTLFLNGTNKTGTAIPKGKAVYVSGATGNHAEITLAIANSEATSARTIGITAEAIGDNATGRVIVAGLLENVDTSAFAAGNVLYLSATSAGGFQTTLPTQPNHGVLLGYVVRSNANTGAIEVRVDNYQELAEQSDVLLTSKANNDLLAYESSSGLWKNKSFATLGLLTSSTAASTYAPIASPTFTGTVTIPAGASISGYLTTSTASSTYAPIASPTFTGTVTIPAGASISGFAPLASPALTGTPTAPTAAAATNTTQIATTAFVQQEVPDASTSAKGKVELATDAEAVAGTSTTLAVTPAGDFMSKMWQGLFLFPTAWTAATSGAGALTGTGDPRIAAAPTSVAGYGLVRALVNSHSRGRAYNSGIDFDKRITVSFRMALRDASTDANSVLRVTIGKVVGDNAGDLARKGVGVKFIGGGLLVLTVHNGTSLTDTNSTHTMSDANAIDVRIVSDAGTVTLFVNGSQVASTTSGPTGLGNTGAQAQIEAENTTTLSGTRISADVVSFRTNFAL